MSQDELNSIINPLDVINFMKYYIQQCRIILSSQADMKCSPDSLHSGLKKKKPHTSKNLKQYKLYKIDSQIKKIKH